MPTVSAVASPAATVPASAATSVPATPASAAAPPPAVAAAMMTIGASFPIARPGWPFVQSSQSTSFFRIAPGCCTACSIPDAVLTSSCHQPIGSTIARCGESIAMVLTDCHRSSSPATNPEPRSFRKFSAAGSAQMAASSMPACALAASAIAIEAATMPWMNSMAATASRSHQL
jgi:hypothetical protein